MKLEGMKIKTYVIEVPTERFIVRIKGIEIVVSDIEDLDQLIDKYKVDEIEPITIPPSGEEVE